MTSLIKAELGLADDPQAVTVDAALVERLDPDDVVTLDLSAQSDAYDEAFVPGGWLRPGIENELATCAVDNGAELVVTRFGQPRLSRSPAAEPAQPGCGRDRHQPVAGDDDSGGGTVGGRGRRSRR